MKRFARFIVLIVVSLVQAQAGLVSVKLAKVLEEQADTIVIASLVGVAGDGSVSTLQMRVLRVLKGSATPTDVIEVTTTEKELAPGGPPPGGGPAALWFLKTAQAGKLSLLPAQTGDVDIQHTGLFVEPDPPAGDYGYAPSDAPIDKIAKELGAFAEREQCVEAEDAIVQSLQKVDTPAMISMLRRLAKSNMTSVRAIGVASLIGRGDGAALQQLEADLNGPFGASAFQRSTGMLNIQAAIELMYRSPDPAGIAVLGRLATSGSAVAQLPRASLYALRSVHTANTLPWLARVLDSSDPAARYDAVLGIAAFANGLPTATLETIANTTAMRQNPNSPYGDSLTRANMPGYHEFLRAEGSYLSFWKDWWARHRAALGFQP